jgi:hypothetical protein
MQVRFNATIVHLKAHSEIHVVASGDFDGEWRLTLTPDGELIHINSPWTITPRRAPPPAIEWLLRPVFRWNHHSSMTAAYSGLQSYLTRIVRHPIQKDVEA